MQTTTTAPATHRIRIEGLRVCPLQQGATAVPQRLANHPLALALLTAAQRLLDIPAAGWLMGVLASMASAAGSDVFTGIYLLTGVFTILDLRWGAVVAIHKGKYSAERKRRGRDAKIITLALLLGLRGIEWWATSWGFLDVAAVLGAVGLSGLAARVAATGGGVVSALITTGVWFEEAQSWELHRRALGGRSIPVWSALLQLGRGASARIAAAAAANAKP